MHTYYVQLVSIKTELNHAAYDNIDAAWACFAKWNNPVS